MLDIAFDKTDGLDNGQDVHCHEYCGTVNQIFMPKIVHSCPSLTLLAMMPKVMLYHWLTVLVENPSTGRQSPVPHPRTETR